MRFYLVHANLGVAGADTTDMEFDQLQQAFLLPGVQRIGAVST